MLEHIDLPSLPSISSPHWQPYMTLNKGSIFPSSNDRAKGKTSKFQEYFTCAVAANPSKPFHKRKASANVPYQFPLGAPPVYIKPKDTTSSIQCCPVPPGDTDDVSAEGPSPPKCKKSNTPASRETNETSHVTSHKKEERENSMQSGEDDADDSLGFLECSEHLGSENISPELSLAFNSVPMQDCFDCEESANAGHSVGSIDSSGKPEIEEADMNPAFGIDTLNYLISRETKYAPDPYYMEKSQSRLTPRMRLILLDWMMEVCMEFKLKRETFHLACNYLDRFLSLSPGVDKSQLQLIGVTSLFMASKFEETASPKVSDFVKSTDDGYSIDQIIQAEMTIGRVLTYDLVPPTLNMWDNWYMCQWDQYIQQSPYATSHPLVQSLPDPLIVFKTPTEKAYTKFREVMQLTDTMLLDISSLQYKPRALVASTLYIILAYYFGQATKEEIAGEFPVSSRFLSMENPFNDLFADFLVQSFGFQLEELLPTIQYVASFMAMQFNYELPTAAQGEVLL